MAGAGDMWQGVGVSGRVWGHVAGVVACGRGWVHVTRPMGI